ncbi:MAG: PilZ domain-containing protein [Desulfobacterales bacterium]
MAEAEKMLNKSDVTFRLFELITDMPEEDQLKLLQELEKRQSRNKRRHVRRNTQLTVYYATQDRAFRDVILNISPTGVFIETREPFIVGQEILLNFTPGRQTEPIRVRGEIVRVAPDGIGVKFIRRASDAV